jgi:arylsulfatase A-like enzyme
MFVMVRSKFNLPAVLIFIISFGFLSENVLAQQKRPNILWITCEDISPYISAYGDPIVQTPNIDQLAKDGIRYLRAYTVAGVCAPSRSSLITGMYPTSIGTQHMRTIGDPKYQPVPSYSAVIPEYVKCFPEYLRLAGYYCTNNEKQDYQFLPPVTVWDENGPAASYRNRPKDKPFFAVFNLFITHESQLFGRTDSLLLDPSQISVPPYYPDTRTVRHDMNRLFTNIERMDAQVGQIIQMLKDDGLYDNTIIFFFSDHGGALPWMKREILERGTHIPFIVHLQKGKGAGTVNGDLVSEVDFAPTVLSLAGVKLPSYLQGQAFLGDQKAKEPRKYVFAGRDRMDTEYDRVRMVRDKRFQYLYNYFPQKPYYQNIEYRLSIPMMKEFLQLRDEGKLDSNQAAWFHTKPVEEFYDLETDPHELHNLVNLPQYQSQLNAFRAAYQEWNKKIGDLGALDEKEMIRQMWLGGNEPPKTEMPVITRTKQGILLSCKTPGASIGYRVAGKGSPVAPEMHTALTWDYTWIFNPAINGTKKPAAPIWTIYEGETIHVNKGDTLIVNAMRIGFKPAELRSPTE